MLTCEGVSLASIAEQVGTPCYVYSRAALIKRYRTLVGSWPQARQPTLAYSMRVNPSRALLSILSSQDAWVCLTSKEELMQAFRAGFSPGRMIFSGMSKSEEELTLALNKEICLVVTDSRSELDRLARMASRTGNRARTAIRVHPLEDGTDGKVGIPMNLAEEVFRHAADTEGLEVVGLHLYMGRQMADSGKFIAALGDCLALIDRLSAAGVVLTLLDIGSSAGAMLDDPAFCELVAVTVGPRMLRIIIEPGHSLVGRTGVLLTTVDHLKETSDNRFLLADASLNDLLSPSLFSTRHEILPVRQFESPDAPLFDVVGPMYEVNDTIGRDRCLAGTVPGDLLCVMDTGAFGYAMASNFGMRPRPPEVLVEDESFRIIRRRETFQDMVRAESDVM
jgi:diaminopimelate decarboxylase